MWIIKYAVSGCESHRSPTSRQCTSEQFSITGGYLLTWWIHTGCEFRVVPFGKEPGAPKAGRNMGSLARKNAAMRVKKNLYVHICCQEALD
jgi:hypothetical protein